MWIPAEDRQAPIQAIRRRFDRNVERWMPHVTLLYPFWPRAHFAEAAERLSVTCERVSPFSLALGRVRTFRHGRDGYTIWLSPEPAEPVIALQARLQAAFPDCDHVSRFAGGFTPHLSVGQARGARERAERQSEIESRWERIAFAVDEVALIAREGAAPFVVERTIPLGGAG